MNRNLTKIRYISFNSSTSNDFLMVYKMVMIEFSAVKFEIDDAYESMVDLYDNK